MKPKKQHSQRKPSLHLPPCRGKVGIGVELWTRNASTPTLTLPLQGGGEVIATAFIGLKLDPHFLGSAE